MSARIASYNAQHSPRDVAESHGLTVRGVHAGPCPACAHASLSITLYDARAYCHRCATLFTPSYLAARLKGLQANVTRSATAETPAEYLSESELAAMTAGLAPLLTDRWATGYLASRIGSARTVEAAMRGLAYARPRPSDIKGYTLAIPLYDAEGEVRNYRLRCTLPTPREGTPKARVRGRVGGLVCANASALTLLATPYSLLTMPTHLVITEGEVDYLCAASELPASVAVMGIHAGAWTLAHARKLPRGIDVCIATDAGETGDAYASGIAATLRETGHMGRVVRREYDAGDLTAAGGFNGAHKDMGVLCERKE